MKENIGIKAKDEKTISTVLNILLADEYVLLTKTRNYHWHVVGPSFMELHKLYEAHYDELVEMIDEIAERTRQIGQQATATLKEFLEITRLKEGPYLSAQTAQIKQLLADHEAVCRNLRKDIATVEKLDTDPVTVDQLTKYLAAHEKIAWMLRSYIAE